MSPIPSPTVKLYPDRLEVLVDGTWERKDLTAYPTRDAILAAKNGSGSIAVHGVIPNGGVKVQVGGGDAGTKGYVAHWSGRPIRVAFLGQTPDARLVGVDLREKLNDGTVTGGIEELYFEDLALEARYTECISSLKGDSLGAIRFAGVHFYPDPSQLAAGAHNGFGYKWGIRSQARAAWELINVTFEPVLEHNFYVDSPRPCPALSFAVLANRWTHLGSTRTAIQVCNRALDNPGPSGSGPIRIENVSGQALKGDGGSLITIAGHLGSVFLRRVGITQGDELSSHGLIAIWTDNSPGKGVHLMRRDEELYSTGHVRIEETFARAPGMDRNCVAVSGARSVYFGGFDLNVGQRISLDLDGRYGLAKINGPAWVDGVEEKVEADIVNGPVRFDPVVTCPALSTYAGWSNRKLAMRDAILSDAQLDQSWPCE